MKYNATVMGIQNYYKAATWITHDLNEISFHCSRVFYNRFKDNIEVVSKNELTKTQQKRYKDYNLKLLRWGRTTFVPIHAQKNVFPKNFSQYICNYTFQGREKVHKQLMLSAKSLLGLLSEQYISDRSIEYHDNRISKFIAQYGKCFIRGKELGLTGWHCHHIIPYRISKEDTFKNLVIIEDDIHKLIHMTDPEKILKMLSLLRLSKRELTKMNKLRIQAGTTVIKVQKLDKVSKRTIL